ncbi:hypothetical protein [Streptomyces sp. NPDC058595]|uniref:hypothetical protein n=1 Tax=Streptomyces sp. NPDC058595 TaxID=3346550 RepID=UPI003668BA00
MPWGWAAGELGIEHGYALPGGERLTLAVGDAVRVSPSPSTSTERTGSDAQPGCFRLGRTVPGWHLGQEQGVAVPRAKLGFFQGLGKRGT